MRWETRRTEEEKHPDRTVGAEVGREEEGGLAQSGRQESSRRERSHPGGGGSNSPRSHL